MADTAPRMATTHTANPKTNHHTHCARTSLLWTLLVNMPTTLERVRVGSLVEGLGHPPERRLLGVADNGVHCTLEAQS
jgi:hypothetical protein